MTALPVGIIATTRADGREVLHLGTLWGGDDAPFNLPGYTYKGVTVPDPRGHGWNQQWTIRPKPITIIRSPSQIVAANRMFPFGDTGCKLGSPPARSAFVSPIDCSGITKYMPTTGERRDIGLVTDPSAWFMLGRSPDDMLDWAQAAGSVPLHFRDENTGRPASLLDYPTANAMDGRGYGPVWFPKGPPKVPHGYTAWADDWGPQQAHFPEMSYLAHVATGDLGFLEDLQYEANFVVLSDAVASVRAKAAVLSGEYRGLSWGMRQLFMAHIATKDAEVRGDLPTQCHPSSYWKTLLDNQLAFYGPAMSDPTNQTFRLFVNGTRFAPWQCNYMIEALAFGVLTGHSDWVPFYLFCLGNVVALTNGTSGFPVGLGSAYYVNTVPHLPVPPGQNPADWRQDNNLDLSGVRFTWARAYDGYVQEQYDVNARMLDGLTDPVQIASTTAWIQDSNAHIAAWVAKLKANPMNNGVGMFGNESLMTTRAVLVQADYLEKIGLISVRSVYPELDTCLANIQRMVLNYGEMNPRASVVSTAPIVVPPPAPPPQTTPTQGNIVMATPALNAKLSATVHFFDDAEVERAVDSVDWSATGAAKIDGSGHGSTAAGVYSGTGAFEIVAVGHIAGASDVTVKVGGTVPVPFPTHGRIDLS